MDPHDAFLRPPARLRAEETGMSRRALLRLRLTGAARTDIDYDGATARVRAGWERGGHDALLRALEPVAEAAVAVAEVAPGERVLDAGAGDGTAALACARRGAEVHACDLAEAMVARGRERCGDAVAWRRADVQALPYPDAAFDVVVSTFGAALAPRARRTARELARVLAPGGRLVLAAWVPRGLPGRLDELVEAIAPLPDGVRPPSAWGEPETGRARLEAHFEAVERRTRTVPLSFPSPDALFAALTAPLGLDTAATAALRPGYDRLLAAQNNRPPAAELDARYALWLGRRPDADSLS